MIDLNPSYGIPYTMKAGQETPKEAMKRIMEENPRAKANSLFKIFADEAISDPDLNMACLLQIAANLHHSIDRLIMEPAERRKIERRKAYEKYYLKKQVDKLVSKVRGAFILDTIMPNKKTARDCTGRYLVKHGGTLAKIGAMVKPSQIVGKYISDKRAQAVLKRAS